MRVGIQETQLFRPHLSFLLLSLRHGISDSFTGDGGCEGKTQY